MADVPAGESTTTTEPADVTFTETVQLEVDEYVFDAFVAGPRDGPVVFLLHGFPQTNQTWIPDEAPDQLNTLLLEHLSTNG